MKLTGTMRLPFIILAPACVLPGIATAVAAGAGIRWWEILLITLGAICAHVAVNVFNEYQDNKSGLDATTKRTPFSGGSGTLQRHPELAKAALALGIAATALTAGFGLYFVLSGRLLLLAVGGLGILVIVFYTPWIGKNPIVCLIAPGLGFGTCMVLGAHIALGADLDWAAVIVSFVPFFLVSNLLLLNQFPDVEADRAVRRRNILITAGVRTGAVVYTVFLVLCYASIGLGVVLSLLPVFSLLGLATIPLAAFAASGAFRYGNETEKLIPALGMNVVTNVLTPVLTAVGIFIGS